MEIEHDEADPRELTLFALERLQKSLRRWSDITPPLLSATEKQIEMIHSRMVQRILYCLDYIHMSTKDEVRTRSA